MKIIDKYILKNLVILYAFSHFILILFFIIIKIADLIDKVVSGNIPFFSLIKIILFIVPSLNSFIFPIATLSAVLLTFSNFSNNNEIIPIKTAGVKPIRLAYIPFIFGIIIFILSLINNIFIVPYSNEKFYNEFKNIAKNKIFNSIYPQKFNEIFTNLIIFPKKVDLEKKELKDILIYDATKKVKQIIISKYCKYGIKNNNIFFKLFNGEIHIKGKKTGNYQLLKFNSYKFNFNLQEIEKNINLRLKDKESSIKKLKEKIKIEKKKKNYEKVRYLQMEIYKRFSFPFACIIFIFIAMPFGLINTKNPKSWSIFILIITIFLYYLILIFSSTFVKKGILNPFLGAWLPNLIFLIIAGVLLHFLNREKWIF